MDCPWGFNNLILEWGFSPVEVDTITIPISYTDSYIIEITPYNQYNMGAPRAVLTNSVTTSQFKITSAMMFYWMTVGF